MGLAQLHECSDAGLNILKNDTCTLYPYLDKQTIYGSNSTFTNTFNYMSYQNLDYNSNASQVFKEVEYLDSTYNRVSDKVYQCENSLRIINQSFEDQKNVCKTRSVSYSIFDWSKSLLFLVIGVILGSSIIIIYRPRFEKLSEKIREVIASFIFVVGIGMGALSLFYLKNNALNVISLLIVSFSVGFFPSEFFTILSSFKKFFDDDSINQEQDNPVASPQVIAKRDVHITYTSKRRKTLKK